MLGHMNDEITNNDEFASHQNGDERVAEQVKIAGKRSTNMVTEEASNSKADVNENSHSSANILAL
jgi:hypothetical protein